MELPDVQLYNTFSRTVEVVSPLKKGEIKLYTCGPTIYNYAHIGNFRAYVWEDLLRRSLVFLGYKVKQVMNLTDVDDKTIRDSQAEGLSLRDFTERYAKAFFTDIDTLGIDRAEWYPRATDFIAQMIEIIQKLIDNKMAYQADDGSVYFSIGKFKDYGKLSKTSLENLKAGARVKQDEYEKAGVADFALWKAYDDEDGDVVWESPWGKGRPGWHIECSAMSMHYLGETFDIHTGGVDNMFPHHENEIAQSEGATGNKFVNLWMHCAHLRVDGQKMSKSLGNFYTLRDLLDKGFDPKALRYTLLSTHYRQPLNFTFESVKASAAAIERLNEVVRKLDGSGKQWKECNEVVSDAHERFGGALADDLNISEAIGVVFDVVKSVNHELDEGFVDSEDAEKLLDFFKDVDSVLNVINFDSDDVPAEIQKLADKRQKARDEKDFAASDKIRDELASKGWRIDDTPEGPRLVKQD